MTPVELMLWSAMIGTIFAVVIADGVDFVQSRSTGSLHAAAYHIGVLLFVVLLSGLLAAAWPQLDKPVLHMAQLLAGPVLFGMGDFLVRGWLGAVHRDRLTSNTLIAGALAQPAVAIAALWLPLGQQLPLVAAVCLLNTAIVVWLCIRAYLMGDRLALGMGLGLLMTLPTMLCLYAMAIGIPNIHLALQLLSVVGGGAGMVLVGFMLWRRNKHARITRAVGVEPSQLDPVTRLLSSKALVRKLINAQERRQRTRREGALLAVMVFDIERLVSQVGGNSVHELYIELARRVQREVGAVNPVGRYFDTCFVSMVESIHSPAALRTLGLRLASSARKPIQVRSYEGNLVQISPDIGVGVVHLSKGGNASVEDILHQVQRAAQAARTLRSRAAMRDGVSGAIVAVEDAELSQRQRKPTRRQPSNPVAPQPLKRPGERIPAAKT